MRTKYKSCRLLIVLAGLLTASPVMAAPNTELEALRKMVQELVLQNKQLTSRVVELEQRVDTVDSPSDGQKNMELYSQQVAADSNASRNKNDSIKVSGFIEVEASWGEDFANESSSNIDLAKADFSLESHLTDWAYGMIGLEWDDKKDKVTVDETFITLGNTGQFPLFIKAGRYNVPFGVFEAKTITDSLVEEAFETKENAVLAGGKAGGLTASVYLFNGDTNEGGGKSNLEQYGAGLEYQASLNDVEYSLGIDFINSVFDADGLSEFFPDFLEADYTAGVGGHFLVSYKGIGLISEYITAVDDLNGIEPEAWQFEGFYTYMLGDRELVISLAYSQTDDLGGHLPESRIAVAWSVELFKNIGLSMEYTHDNDYDVSDGGTGEGADTFTTQLSYEL